jgi:hypothetical protein
MASGVDYGHSVEGEKGRARRPGRHGGRVRQRRIPLAGTGQQPVLPEDRLGHAGIRAMADAVPGDLRRQATVHIDA